MMWQMGAGDLWCAAPVALWPLMEGLLMKLLLVSCGGRCPICVPSEAGIFFRPPKRLNVWRVWARGLRTGIEFVASISREGSLHQYGGPNDHPFLSKNFELLSGLFMRWSKNWKKAWSIRTQIKSLHSCYYIVNNRLFEKASLFDLAWGDFGCGIWQQRNGSNQL